MFDLDFYQHLNCITVKTTYAYNKHNIDLLSPYKIDMADMLANSFLFTHTVDTDQHFSPCGDVFLYT